MSRQRFVEWLERRLFLSAQDLLNDEEQTLELINRMRQNPAAELPLIENSTDPGIQLGLSFFKVNLTTLASQWATLVPVPPLAMNSILQGTALAHDQLMLADNSQMHQLPGEEDLSTRILAAGYNFSSAGESIFIAATSVFDAHAAFAIDWGNGPNTVDGIQSPPGHRENIMDPSFTEMGIAVLSGPGVGDGALAGPLVFTEDFGSQETPDGPFLLGAAFQDTNGDGFYTAGEGLAGITVKAAGTGGTMSTTTTSTGAYQMAMPAGTYTVTFSGGSLSTPKTYENVVIGANNVELDMNTLAPAITSAGAATFVVGAEGTFAITTTITPPVTISDSNFTLPSGLAFTDNGDGTASIAGAPAAGTGGTYVFTLTADNGVVSPATQTFTLIVDEASAITSAGIANFLVGANSTFALTTTGFPAVTLGESGALPSGVTFTNSTGVLHWQSTAASTGVYQLTFTATNGVGGIVDQPFTLMIGQAPAITSLNHATVKAGLFQAFTVTAAGFPVDVFDPVVGLPAGVSFVDNGNGTATIGGTVGVTAGGNYAVTLAARNSNGAASQTFTLTVDQAPTITSAGAAMFTVGAAQTFNIDTSGFPAVTVTEIGALPLGLSVKTVGGQPMLFGTPLQGTGKTYGITLVAANGILPAAMQAFTLTVDQVPAIATIGTPVFSTLKAVTFPVKVTGFPTPVLSAMGLPNGIVVSTLPNGTTALTGTAVSDQSGPYTATLTATNSAVGGTVGHVLTMSVDHPAGISGGTTATFTTGMAGTFNITTSGFPAPTVSNVGALPLGVTVKKNVGGQWVISGTPAAGTGKTYGLSLVATNGIGTSSSEPFTLTVDQPPAISTVGTPIFSTLKAVTFPVKVTGFQAPVLSAMGLPAGIVVSSFSNGTTALTGTVASDQSGPYTATLSATSTSGTAAQVLTMSVDHPAGISGSTTATFVTGTAGTFSITTGGFPAPTVSNVGALPLGVTVKKNIGGQWMISGTPAAGTGKTYGFTLVAANGIGVSSSESFTLTVDQAPFITVPPSVIFSTLKAGTVATTTTGFPAPTVMATGLPSGLTLNANGTITGTALSNDAPGSYIVSLAANNGVGQPFVKVFTLLLDEASTISSANNATFTAGTLQTFMVQTSGFPAATLLETGALPAGLRFIPGTGGIAMIVGTPVAATAGKTFALVLSAGDGIGARVSQDFTLTVNWAN